MATVNGVHDAPHSTNTEHSHITKEDFSAEDKLKFEQYFNQWASSIGQTNINRAREDANK
jgi:hypothetical protein